MVGFKTFPAWALLALLAQFMAPSTALQSGATNLCFGTKADSCPDTSCMGKPENLSVTRVHKNLVQVHFKQCFSDTAILSTSIGKECLCEKKYFLNYIQKKENFGSLQFLAVPDESGKCKANVCVTYTHPSIKGYAAFQKCHQRQRGCQLCQDTVEVRICETRLLLRQVRVSIEWCLPVRTPGVCYVLLQQQGHQL